MALPPGFEVISGGEQAALPEGFVLDQEAPEAQSEAIETAEAMPEGSALDVVLEPAQAVLAGLGGQVASGLAGAYEAATDGAEEATETIEGIQQAAGEWGAPETQRGQQAMQTLGDIVEAGIDIARFPVSGLAGLAELISGQGIEQAAKTVKDIQEKGIGQTAGDRVFEETGDPLLAATAATSPELVASIIPVAHMAKTRSAYRSQVAEKIRKSSAQPQLAREIRQVSDDVSAGNLTPNQASTALIQMQDDIARNSGREAAEQVRNLADDVKAGNAEAPKALNDLSDQIESVAADRTLAKYIASGSRGAKVDRLAQEAVKQGFDQSVISMVKGATDVDRAKMAKMLDIMRKGKADRLYAGKNRPADIAGNSLLERVNYVKRVNRDAGKELEQVAKGLRGQSADFSKPINNFLENLDEMGVSIGRDLKPRFTGSDIEGVKGAETAISNIVKRLASGKGEMPDAYELHRMKKYIDEQVTYGKAAEGLAGKTESILKSLRRDLDDALDQNFPDYDRVNTTYADTISAIDSIQDSIGRKVDLLGPNADKALGTSLRRLLSNTTARANLGDAIDEVQNVTRKYGGQFDDSIDAQILFADELDSVFGPVARTSLAGETAKGMKEAFKDIKPSRGVFGTIKDVAKSGMEKATGVTDETRFKAMEDILKRTP